MKFLEWKTPNGCASCRPALNYYLISTWPGEARDDPQSRFINERAHANIQKDGTYSRGAAHVGRADHAIRAARHRRRRRQVSGADGEDDRRRSASTCSASRRKTCQKSGRPRCGRHGLRPCLRQEHPHGQDLRRRRALPLRHAEVDGHGRQAETMLFGMWSPHKVKLAVSGCPRNCAEAGIKDVGVIGVDSGYELYVGGNGGIKTEVAQFFCKVKNDDEVMEYSGAFLQLYREEGYYLERTCHYVARVGLDHVKAAVVDDPPVRRKELYERLLFALQDYEDPWQAAVQKPAAVRREYEVIKLKEIPAEALS
jgi:nitrite reductase (NADH) large subunit